MKKLDEHEIAQGYIGKHCDTEKILQAFEQNGEGDEYIAYCCCYSDEECQLFGITPILREKWEFYGIDFSIYLDLKDEKVSECYIVKYKETYSGHGRPEGDELIPTQQEIRIFRRIMDFIIKKE